MIILTIDSATDTFGTAILDNGIITAEIILSKPRRQLKYLSDILHSTLRYAELEPSQIDYVAVTNGPGSFTGLRLAVTTAKTTAHLTDAEIIEINTLDAIAERVTPFNGLTVAALDARRGEIFGAIYGDSPDGKVRKSEYMALSPELFTEKLSTFPEIVINGNGGERYERYIREKLPQAKIYPKQFATPSPSSIGAIAIRKINRKETIPWHQASVFYMRKSEAEETRELKLQNDE